MAAPRRSRSLRDSAVPPASPRPRGAAEPELGADSGLDGDLELEWLSAESDEERGGGAAWQPGERSAAAALLGRCVAAGALSQVPPGPP